MNNFVIFNTSIKLIIGTNIVLTDKKEYWRNVYFLTMSDASLKNTRANGRLKPGSTHLFL